MSLISKIKKAYQLGIRFVGVARRNGLSVAIASAKAHPSWDKLIQNIPFLVGNSEPAHFINPFKDVLVYQLSPNHDQPIYKEVNLCYASQGNFFMTEIAKLIGHGLTEAGYRVNFVTEQTANTLETSQLTIVVAPHEFFLLGKTSELVAKVKNSKHLIMLNTEQSQTTWFAKAYPFLRMAHQVWDMNFNSSVILRANKIDAFFLPLGYSTNYQDTLHLEGPLNRTAPLLSLSRSVTNTLPVSYSDRPIDILFVGTLSEKRKGFFAQYAPFFANYECFFYLPEGRTPFIEGAEATINFEQMAKLALRSKIIINIHRDEDSYLEWQRIVNLGILYGGLVISETCDQCPALLANIDYVDCPLAQITQQCEYYLSRLDSAEQFAKRAQNRLKQLSMTQTLQSLLQFSHISK